MSRRRVLAVVGTRPEAIKMAPVVRALAARADRFEPRLCVTGQHRELLDQVLAVFDLRPDADLDVMTPAQDIFDVTAAVLGGMRGVLAREAPDLVLVHGDTTSCLAAALAASYAGVPVGHVEAGLRTGDRRRPFPEEINRRLTDALADLHFAPTEANRANLLAEGLDPAGVVVTGNTVVDALLLALPRARATPPPLALDPARRLVLVTCHRRESFGAPLERICRAIAELAARPDVEVAYPVHPNPNVRGPVTRLLGGLPRVHLLPPQPYLPFVWLMDRAHFLLTDSGGLQEEAPSLDTPVLVMRDVTERPEAVAAGAVEVCGTDPARILAACARLLDDPAHHARMAAAENPYGDGHAAARIADAIEAHP